MTGKRATKCFHRLHLAIQLSNLRAQEIANSPTFFSTACSQQILDLVQRQTQLLRLLYETDSLNHLRPEETEASAAAKRPRQQSSALVETDRVNGDSSTFRQISDLDVRLSHE
jgi:hypothetical protein